ncbi:MAG: signal recognition particle protein, partial [Acidimicrobiaceae bacterium]|nr:signal recognition particle protein [Acidimicrobiaceae bacterium]
GEELSRALNPAQQVVKIVLSELTASLGGERLALTYASKPPTVVLLAGLQGTGKTTNAAKLAQWFLRQGRSPLLVGADLQRPAAVEQLRTLGGRVGVPVFSHSRSPVKAASASLAEATRTGRDVVIVDTAGRLAIDAEMMDQVRRISKAVKPHYTFLVVDATVGQDAVSSARAFHDSLALDGVILTKLDGDARGGAALSVKEVVGRPIAFASVGEKLDDFEPFHPDRLASRILGMGDVETLIDKAESAFEAEEAEQTATRLLEGTFTLDDFLSTMQQVLGMGNLRSLIGMMPGVPRELRSADIDEGRIGRITGMIHSMTPAERADPDIIDASRRQRIAAGSGCRPADVKSLIDQFKQMRSMRKGLGGLGGKRSSAGSRARSPKQSGRSKQKAGAQRRGGGRTTPKGPKPVSKTPLALPGLEKGDWPGFN